ncbi:MAG: hypothetical protein IPL25_10285 [Saprospiraceae bacterium]|nr:hypothetical protein [Candidatus Vicinibacter affinis]
MNPVEVWDSRSVPEKEESKSFWQKVGGVLETVVDNVPIIGGLKYAVESAIAGDWKGALIGLGEATLDATLLLLRVD